MTLKDVFIYNLEDLLFTQNSKKLRQTLDKRFSPARVCVMKDEMEGKQKANCI